MIRGMAVVALLLSAAAAPADKPKGPVSLEATVGTVGAAGEVPQLRVRLVGAAKDAAVITEGLSAKVTRGDKTATVSLTPAERTDDKGRRIIPSADRLAIVRLQPGEVAIVQVPLSPALRQALTAARAGEVALVVEYAVSEAWGKRFGVVSTRLRGTATLAE